MNRLDKTATLQSEPCCQDNASKQFAVNNFDAIRLFAAVQVAVEHSIGHLNIRNDSAYLISYLLSLVPGVPIFFFVSGFLISRSFENRVLTQEYFINRILRIYPALIVCTGAAFISLYAVGYLPGAAANISGNTLTMWLGGQVTIFQFYNPNFMREFGSGVFNGSLWTIAVELQFYILVPILYSITSLTARNRTQGNVIVVTVILFFLVANRVIDGVASRNWEWLDSLALTLGAGGRTDLGLKLLNVSFLPWFYMFLVGVLVQRNFAWTLTLVRGKGMHLFVLYIAIAVCGREMFDINTGNRIEPLLFLILVACVFACAYTMPYLSNKILKRNDVSYGVYIYHMPVINIALYLGCERRGDCLLYVLLTTLMLATLSWTFIERPILRLKKHPLKVPK